MNAPANPLDDDIHFLKERLVEEQGLIIAALHDILADYTAISDDLVYRKLASMYRILNK